MEDEEHGLLIGGELVLAGFVGDDWMGEGFTHAGVVRALDQLGGADVTVRLNSGGGFAPRRARCAR